MKSKTISSLFPTCSTASNLGLNYLNFASLTIQNVLSAVSDQTARMCRLIELFAGRTRRKCVFWHCGSYTNHFVSFQFWPMLEKNFTEGMPKEGTAEREHCDKGTLYELAANHVINLNISLRKHAYSNIPQKKKKKKKWKFSDKKKWYFFYISAQIWYFSYFCINHRFWLLRTASARRF